jgi:hypothetical protein
VAVAAPVDDRGAQVRLRPLGPPPDGVEAGERLLGDLDVEASDHGVTGRLRITDLRLEAFRRPAACNQPAGPIAVLPGEDRVTIPVGTAYGLNVLLLDTAACAPVVEADRYVVTWTAADPAVLDVVGDGPRAELHAVAAGQTAVHVTATDPATGAVAAEADVAVSASTAPDRSSVAGVAVGIGQLPSPRTARSTSAVS